MKVQLLALLGLVTVVVVSGESCIDELDRLIERARDKYEDCDISQNECENRCEDACDEATDNGCGGGYYDCLEECEEFACEIHRDCSSSSSDDRCKQVSSDTVHDCGKKDDEDDCEKCCRNECEHKNDCDGYKCRDSDDCHDFDFCYDDCVADAECSSISDDDCHWCDDDDDEIVCWKGNAFQVCRRDGDDCDRYGSSRFDWKPDRPWRDVEKYRRESSEDHECDDHSDDRESGGSCGSKIDDCCECLDDKCGVSSDESADSSDKDCVKDHCKNEYCKAAGDCAYGSRDKWKKVVEYKCDVDW